ncbi:MAG: phosphoadenosine phosphosulfate reductase [Deltaproteobacteria bacterium]|jgi:thioredoxin-dependent adenylylsulfate APS reductase|nr:MAG: phosphoadenosine phosphosulfate reductase [Deltaproteobacteria bacterium]
MTERKTLDELEVNELAMEFEDKEAQDVIKWALDEFHPRIYIAWSGQAEDMVILDIAHKINPEVRAFALDTGRMHNETYELIEKVREKYGTKIEIFFPNQREVEEMVNEYGVNLMYRDVAYRHLCCEIRKVRPLIRALSKIDGWFTGMRREQWASRQNIRKIEIDHDHGQIVKVNPLADWSHEDVWNYIRENDVPYNELYDKGFTSIGCAPCTRPVKPGEDPRAGRWWWEVNAPKECGIHCSIETGGFEKIMDSILQRAEARRD